MEDSTTPDYDRNIDWRINTYLGMDDVMSSNDEVQYVNVSVGMVDY